MNRVDGLIPKDTGKYFIELCNKNKQSIPSKNYITDEKSSKEYKKIIKKCKIKTIKDPYTETILHTGNQLMKTNNKIKIGGDKLYVPNIKRIK